MRQRHHIANHRIRNSAPCLGHHRRGTVRGDAAALRKMVLQRTDEFTGGAGGIVNPAAGRHEGFELLQGVRTKMRLLIVQPLWRRRLGIPVALRADKLSSAGVSWRPGKVNIVAVKKPVAPRRIVRYANHAAQLRRLLFAVNQFALEHRLFQNAVTALCMQPLAQAEQMLMFISDQEKIVLLRRGNQQLLIESHGVYSP